MGSLVSDNGYPMHSIFIRFQLVFDLSKAECRFLSTQWFMHTSAPHTYQYRGHIIFPLYPELKFVPGTFFRISDCALLRMPEIRHWSPGHHRFFVGILNDYVFGEHYSPLLRMNATQVFASSFNAFTRTNYVDFSVDVDCAGLILYTWVGNCCQPHWHL